MRTDVRLRYAEIQFAPVRTLRGYDRNVRTHSDTQISQIGAAIERFGFTQPLVVDEHDVVIAGHGRLAAAMRIGMDEVPVIRVTGLSEAERAALVLADNRIALNAGWDETMLAKELQSLQESIDAGELEFELGPLGGWPDARASHREHGLAHLQEAVAVEVRVGWHLQPGRERDGGGRACHTRHPDGEQRHLSCRAVAKGGALRSVASGQRRPHRHVGHECQSRHAGARTARVGRYQTYPGDVAAQPSSYRPVEVTVNGVSAIGGGVMIRARGSGNDATYVVIDLVRGGETVVPGPFGFQGSRLVAVRDGAWMVTCTANSTFGTTSMRAGARLEETFVAVPASGTLPDRSRFVPVIYEDAPLALAYRGTPGSPATGLYLGNWQRPRTTGTIGRGVANTVLALNYAVRAGVAYLPSQTTLYEHELSAVLATGVDGAGNAYTTRILRKYETVLIGFLSLGDTGKLVTFSTRVRVRETDIRMFADGTHVVDGRASVQVSEAFTDVAPANARDGNGILKGAPGYQPVLALPGVMGQRYMLAVCALHIDRYIYAGVFVDRMPVPAGAYQPVSSTPLAANVPWQHHGILTDGSQDVRTFIYLAHDNLLGIPNSNNALYLFVATRDEGETWFSTSVNNGAGTGPRSTFRCSLGRGCTPFMDGPPLTGLHC